MTNDAQQMTNDATQMNQPQTYYNCGRFFAEIGDVKKFFGFINR